MKLRTVASRLMAFYWAVSYDPELRAIKDIKLESLPPDHLLISQGLNFAHRPAMPHSQYKIAN